MPHRGALKDGPQRREHDRADFERDPDGVPGAQDGAGGAVLIGHADPRGSTESNKELSAERAEGARNYMAEHGVASQNPRVIARGGADAHGDNEAGRKRDRRINFELGPTGSDRAPTSNAAAKTSH
ncbi:MAG: OmpA family protein [Polyangiaceae bacterium]